MADALLVLMRALRKYFACVMKYLDLKGQRHFCSRSSVVSISFHAAENLLTTESVSRMLFIFLFFLLFFLIFIYNTYITYNTCVLKYVLQYLRHY